MPTLTRRHPVFFNPLSNNPAPDLLISCPNSTSFPLPVHSFVLATASPFLKSILPTTKCCGPPTPLILPEVAPHLLPHLLQLLYTGQVTLQRLGDKKPFFDLASTLGLSLPAIEIQQKKIITLGGDGNGKSGDLAETMAGMTLQSDKSKLVDKADGSSSDDEDDNTKKETEKNAIENLKLKKVVVDITRMSTEKLHNKKDEQTDKLKNMKKQYRATSDGEESDEETADFDDYRDPSYRPTMSLISDSSDSDSDISFKDPTLTPIVPYPPVPFEDTTILAEVGCNCKGSCVRKCSCTTSGKYCNSYCSCVPSKCKYRGVNATTPDRAGPNRIPNSIINRLSTNRNNHSIIPKVTDLSGTPSIHESDVSTDTSADNPKRKLFTKGDDKHVDTIEGTDDKVTEEVKEATRIEQGSDEKVALEVETSSRNVDDDEAVTKINEKILTTVENPQEVNTPDKPTNVKRVITTGKRNKKKLFTDAIGPQELSPTEGDKEQSGSGPRNKNNKENLFMDAIRAHQFATPVQRLKKTNTNSVSTTGKKKNKRTLFSSSSDPQSM